MWPFNFKKKEPDFGFKVQLVQKHDNMIVYAGYGIRIVENLSKGSHTYQLRVKDEALLDWILKGTFEKPGEVRKKLREILEEKELHHTV